MDLTHRLAALRDLPAPVAVVDLAAFDANAAELLDRAGGLPVRVATKSVRVPDLVERALAAGFTGLMAYSLPEALWWVDRGVRDVLVGYPSVDRSALAALASSADALAAVTLMVDDVAHLDLLDAAGVSGARLCIEVDASLRWGPGLPERRRVHLGVRRSPLRSPRDVARLAAAAQGRGHRVRGLMSYEAQVAGLPDVTAGVRLVKRASLAELARRRGEVVSTVQAALGRDLDLVNGGGTGSLHVTRHDPAVTELTAGSGLLQPTLFDGYRPRGVRGRLVPAAYLGLDVVRRPAASVATLFGGGYVASGPAGRERLPRPVLPGGLRLTRTEGAGEVQTPVGGAAADRLGVGDRVWLRHAKAGEVMERFASVTLLPADGTDGPLVTVPTYRGLGLSFG